VIIIIAFFVVQWEADLPIKIMVVLLGSFVLIVGIYELLVQHLNPVRTLFGMGPKEK
jgi:hypothetical protein